MTRHSFYLKNKHFLANGYIAFKQQTVNCKKKQFWKDTYTGKMNSRTDLESADSHVSPTMVIINDLYYVHLSFQCFVPLLVSSLTAKSHQI